MLPASSRPETRHRCPLQFGQSANIGAALIVSLGCEGTDHERIVREIAASGKPVEIIRIQELGGTSRAIQAGIDAAQKLVMEISGLQRETVDASEIIMSIKCGAPTRPPVSLPTP